LDKKLTRENLKDLFKSLDADHSGGLDLKEFTKLLDYTENRMTRIQGNIDPDTRTKIEQDADRLFRRVDANHNGYIDVEELYQLLKPIRPGKISLAECKQVISRFDVNSDGQLDQEEFHNVVKHEIQENLTKNLIDIENYKKIFRLQDHDKDGQLSISEFRNTILTKIEMESIDESDLDELISFLDPDGDGLLNIEEFFMLLQKSGTIDFTPDTRVVNSEQNEKKKRVQRCLLEIRKSMSSDLFEYFNFYSSLPDFFEPSFLQSYLEKECRNMPAKGAVREDHSAVA